jgi:hypothetical protein
MPKKKKTAPTMRQLHADVKRLHNAHRELAVDLKEVRAKVMGPLGLDVGLKEVRAKVMGPLGLDVGLKEVKKKVMGPLGLQDPPKS